MPDKLLHGKNYNPVYPVYPVKIIDVKTIDLIIIIFAVRFWGSTINFIRINSKIYKPDLTFRKSLSK